MKAKDQEEHERHIQNLYKDFSLKDLELIASKEEAWKDRVKNARAHSGEKLKCGDKELTYDFSMRSSQGVRAEGGGVTLVLRHVYEKVAEVFELERSCGHPCNAEFLMDEFMYYAEKMKDKLDQKEKMHNQNPKKQPKLTKEEEREIFTRMPLELYRSCHQLWI